MSAQLKENPLYNVDFMIDGKPQRKASGVTLAEARQVRGFARAVRIYRADRQKPLPLKLGHSIRPKRKHKLCSAWRVQHKAELMAAHIRRTGATTIYLFPDVRGGRYSETRAFNLALQHALQSIWSALTVVRVDPAEYVSNADVSLT